MAYPCLIIGGDSAIGRHLARYWAEHDIDFYASTRQRDAVSNERPYIDLANGMWESIQETSYKSVVFCAAVTGLVNCENDKSLSYRVNVENSLNLAKTLSGNAEYLLFLSTNKVSDRSNPFCHVSELPSPKSEYGKQKAEAEAGFMSLPHAGVLRLGKVVHDEWPLLRSWKNGLRAGQVIEAYSDLTFSPIKIEDVVLKIDELLRARKSSIFHFSASEDVSYFKFAKDLALELGANPDLVKGVLQRDDAGEECEPVSASGR